MADARWAAPLALLFNAFVWGISWWPFRELQARGLHPLWATALVFLFSLACVAAARPRAWRAFRAHPLLWLLAAASGVTNLAFNWGVTVGDVVRVVLLFYLMPAWAALLAWLLLGEKPTGGAVLRIVLALAGVLIVLRTPQTPWPLPRALVDWLALLGGLSFALTTTLLRKLQDVPGEARVLAMFGGGVALACAAAAAGAAQGLVASLPAPQAGWLALTLALGLAFLCSNLAMQYGAARLPANTTALIMLSEVVFASVSSVLLDAATMSAQVLLGAALILGAAAWSALAAGRTRMGPA